jgi:hypothetical protein
LGETLESLVEDLSRFLVDYIYFHSSRHDHLHFKICLAGLDCHGAGSGEAKTIVVAGDLLQTIDSSKWKRMGSIGIFFLTLSLVMTRSFALFDIMKADTFFEIVSAKEVKAGGSGNKEHPLETGSGMVAGALSLVLASM